jgi:hypothetical protein
VAHIRRCGICRREVQPRSAAGKEQSNAQAGEAPAVVVSKPPELLVSRKPSADHPWRQKNYATKAAMTQAAAHARK